MMSPEAQPPKRQRTEAQKAAFAKMQQAREAAIIAKFKSQQPRKEDPVDAPAAAPAVQCTQQGEPKQEVAEPTWAQAIPNSEPTLAQAAPALSPPSSDGMGLQFEDQDEDEYDIVEWDPSTFHSHVDSTKAEMARMQKELDGLRQQHTELHGSFQTHYIKTHNGLNFV